MVAILAHGNMTGQGEFARHIALNTSLSLADAVAAMAAATLDSKPTMPATNASRTYSDQLARGRQIAMAALGKTR